jgi:hypothetical protein
LEKGNIVNFDESGNIESTGETNNFMQNKESDGE